MTEKTKKKDFVEIKYTGYANGELFDSNIEKDLKELDEKAIPKKTIVIIGEGMLVKGLDKELENKEIGKEYEIEFGAKEGFGERDRNLIKTIPKKIFSEKNMNPQPGMVFNMDNAIARVVSISGGRVLMDFNNPLSGKNIKYKFKIIRIVKDEKEKVESVFANLFKMVPQFEISEKNIIIKGPKGLENFVNAFKDKFKEFIGKELKFKEMTKGEVEEDLKRMAKKEEKEKQ